MVPDERSDGAQDRVVVSQRQAFAEFHCVAPKGCCYPYALHHELAGCYLCVPGSLEAFSTYRRSGRLDTCSGLPTVDKTGTLSRRVSGVGGYWQYPEHEL